MTKNTIILILAAAVFVLLFFRKCSNDPVKPITIPVKEVVKTVEKVEVESGRVIDSLKRREAAISGRLVKTEKDYKGAVKLVNELLNDVTVIVDSSGNDSLKNAVTQLAAENVAKDSLCAEISNDKDSLIVSHRKQIDVKDSLYSTLRSGFNTMVQNDKLNTDYIKQLRKQVKRKKFGTNIWKIAAGVAGGLYLNERLK